MNSKQINRRGFLKSLGLATAAFTAPCLFARSAKSDKPNIIYILADDMGYGDIEVLNKDCKIPTPNLNKLARGGKIFADAHSGSAVCTPTRYGVLTGRYCWRSRLKRGVLGGYSPALIEPGRSTVASYLKRHGYTCACIGKWHLGLGNRDKTDYTRPLRPGPNEVGFDYSFIIPASLDMAPYCYVENGLPTVPPTDHVDGSPSPAFWRAGPVSPGLKHIDVLPTITQKTVEFIDRTAAKSPGTPFFVYLPLTAPHTPIVPNKEFIGKSGIGPYGDFVCEVDHSVGQVVKVLERHNLTENTLVVFTSDNGCSPEANFKALAEFGHNPSYVFRGHKADIFEGGHRIPFIASWPGRIKPGTSCDETICLTDLHATAAQLMGEPLPEDAAEDSVGILPVLLDEKYDKPLREATVHHSINGSFSIRQGKWKLELCPGSGGWSSPRPETAKKLVEENKLPAIQLYNLENDIAESTNVQDKRPDVVERLSALLDKYKSQGHSRYSWAN